MTGRTADTVPVARIRQLAPLPSPSPPQGLDPAWPVRNLNLNEAPVPPAPKVLAAMREACGALNRYPDHEGTALVAALAKRTGVSADRIVIGAGTNELLFLSGDVALDPGDHAVAPVPSFPTYARVIAMRGAELSGIEVRSDGVVDTLAMIAAVTAQTRLLFTATPNNPTGGMMSREDIEHLVEQVPDHVLLHFDEAYFEFGMHAGGPDALPIIARRKGPWIITRSFSKAYSLAGARVGYGIASSPELAEAYRKIRVTFSVSAIALAGARAAFDETDYVAALLDHNTKERAFLAVGLEKLGMRVLPSAANFVMALADRPASQLAGQLARKNIFILPVPWPAGNGSLRITIGSHGDMEAVVAALAEAIKAS